MSDSDGEEIVDAASDVITRYIKVLTVCFSYVTFIAVMTTDSTSIILITSILLLNIKFVNY